jgi:serine/threonine protein kinase
MSVKCPKCQHENPDTVKFCGECGTLLRSVRGTDPTDAGPDPRSGRPYEDIPVTETMEVPKEELTTGSTFAGRYQIIEELGKGGMGRVYKANDIDVKEKVAIKLIKAEISSDKRTIERFQNELKFARIDFPLTRPAFMKIVDKESIPFNSASWSNLHLRELFHGSFSI